MSEFCIGQRWISNSETRLGLGIVTEVDGHKVSISFPAAGEVRIYASENAPLTRIFYQSGDRIKNLDGEQFTVERAHQANGLYFYEVTDDFGETSVLPELELDCFVRFNSPRDRLLSGQIDPLKFFELRHETRQYQYQYQQSPALGLLGPRVQLLPHQLYIAHQVGSRIHPRVLLADEVGLGKTIEAGLIIHRQLQNGLARRVLIVVPDSLLHQWLVEMLRRFNLHFTVLDEQLSRALEHQGDNPFESSQLILCPQSFLLNDEMRLHQALSAEWNLLVVDEAHHLQWSREHISPEYACIESLAAVSDGVLLLTATPEQLGLESHFARLRLLDPDRYFDFDAFLAEQEQYQPVSALVQKLNRQDISELTAELADFLGPDEIADIKHLIDDNETEKARDQAMDALLDRHGTGRVLFRNTRAAIQGFPARHLISHALDFNEDHRISAAVEDWLHIENILGLDWLQLDERVSWLTDLLKSHRQEKFLLICANTETAITLEEYLRTSAGVRSAVFHEGMSLINRDRAAAYFADTEQAAQILVCSEIGSEGRNFQFAHHIILFDLPLNPDLLEQRIGRLDRIGQTQDITIHVPYYRQTPQQILLDWYHQALNAFEQTCAIGHSVYEEFEDLLLECLQEQDAELTNQLIEQSKQRAEQLRDILHDGRDQLLEMNSCRPQAAQAIIQHITDSENRLLLEDFVEQFSDQLGLQLEMQDQDAIILYPSDHMQSGNLPGLPDEGITATYNRNHALSRDDIAFLSWEHPLIQGAIHMILDSNHGNTSIGTLKLKPLKPGTLMLETFFCVECIAPEQLQLDQFLPQASIRTLVSIDGKDLSELLSHSRLSMLLERVPVTTARAAVKQAREAIETLLNNAQHIAESRLPTIIDDASHRVEEMQQYEIGRLQALAKINPNIRQSEIDYLQDMATMMLDNLKQANLRLDAMRLIIAV